MSTKHTSGPWAAFTDDSGAKPHTNIVAYVPRTAVVFSLPGREKTEADVRLIAAAPDLLEALVSVLDSGSMTGSEWVFDKVCAAITKATGEQA